MYRVLSVFRPWARREHVGLRLALIAAFLLVLLAPAFSGAPFDPPRTVAGDNRAYGDHKAVVGNDGLVYLLWKSGDFSCPNDSRSYSDTMHITALSSGHEFWEDEVDFDFGPAGELFFTIGLGADIDTGSTWDDLYVAWAARDDCDQTFRQIRYGRLQIYKDPSLSVSIASEDTVSCKVWRCKGPHVTLDKDDNIHFAWTDQRCDQIGESGDHHFGMPFYRKRSAAGTWLNTGRQCRRSPWLDSTWTDTTKTWADSAWSDNASVVTFEMQGGEAGTDSCICCPRDFGCIPDSCAWFQGQVFETIDDSQGRLHFLWHDTFCNTIPGVSGDNTMHRSISGSETWEDTTMVSTGSHNFIGGTGTLISGDTLVAFYRDYYDPSFGLWYRFKGSGAFSDPGLAWQDTVRAGYKPGYGSKVAVTSDGDSAVHMVFESVDHRVVCPFGSLGMLGTLDVGEDTLYINALFHREGVFDHANREINWDARYQTDSQADRLTTADDTTRINIGDVVYDACGRVHVFYTHKVTSTGCGPVVRSRLNHLVSRDTISVCSILFPAGGEDWCIGAAYPIRWKLCPRTDRRVVKQSIHLKRGAGSWSVMTDSVPALTRAYEWTATQPVSNGCKIMVVAHMDRWDENTKTWVAAEPCSCIGNNFRIKQCGGPCPHLFAWKDGGFALENSILQRQYGARTPVDDYLLLDNLKPDEAGLIRLKIADLEPDTTFLHAVAVTQLCAEEKAMVSIDGALFKTGPTLPAITAICGEQDILGKILEIDNDVVVGSKGATASITWPRLTGREALLMLRVGEKPPVNPDFQTEGPGPGLHMAVEGDARFVTAAGKDVSITLQPRQFLSTVAVRIVGTTEDQPLKLTMTWHSDHPVDYVGLDPDAAEMLPESGPLQPCMVEFLGAGGQADQQDFPYRIAPGEELNLDFRPEVCGVGEAGAYLIWLNGYYVAGSPSAGINERLPLAMWLTSPMPCKGTSLAGKFSIPEYVDVDLKAYDAQGRLIRTIIASHVGAGIHSFDWDLRSDSGTRIAPGLYFLRFKTPGRTINRKVVVKR
jgi:hypothetical protein